MAEQYLRAAPIAAVVAQLRGCRLVVDGFVGIHETAVEDWRVARPGSLRARRFRLQDRFAHRVADCTLIDTDVRGAALREHMPRAATVLTLPVGAPEWARPTPPSRSAGTALRVLYYGNYIPLHGLDTVLRALSLTTVDVHLTMLGNGARRPRYERLARELGLEDRVTFTGSVPESELAKAIAEHDVVLGVFGDSQKAATVIANKTWQGLACSRTVITRRSDALVELAPIAGDLLVQVDVEHDAPRELALTLDRVAAAPPHHDPGVAVRLEQYVTERFRAFGSWLDGGIER